MRFGPFVWGFVAFLGCAGLLYAAPDRGSIVVSPAEVKLDSRRAYRQFVVTGQGSEGAYDLTHAATYLVSDSRVAVVQGGRVVPVGNGKATIRVTVGGRTKQVPVVVSNFAKPDPVRFKFETLATLTKQ